MSEQLIKGPGAPIRHDAPGPVDVARLGLPAAWIELSYPAIPAVSEALRDLQQATPSVARPAHRGLQVVENSGRFDLWSDGHGIRADVAAGDLVDALVATLNQWVLDTDPYRLHLHAACVELDGTGIVLAGPSGNGKTTTTTALLQRGAMYLTDESLTVPPGTRTVFAYPKPLTIKTGPGSAVPTAPLPPPASTGRVALRASTMAPIASHASVGIVVFPTFRAGSAPILRQLAPAEAVQRLLSDSLDGRRLGVGAIDVVASLVGRAACAEITYGDPGEAAALVAGLRSPEQTTWRASLDLRAEGRRTMPSLRMAEFSDSAILLDDCGHLLELHQNEAKEILQRSTGAGRDSDSTALQRVAAAGLSIPSRFEITTAGRTGYGRSWPRAARTAQPVDPAIDQSELVHLWAQLERAGHEPILAGRIVALTEAATPRGVEVADGNALLLVDPDHLSNASEICQAHNIRAASSIAPTPFSDRLGHRQLALERSPLRIGGRWVSAVSQYHRFVHACFAVAFASESTWNELAEVVVTAPRTHTGAVGAISRSSEEGFVSIVHWATSKVQTAIGGLPPELLPQPGHRPTRVRRSLAALWHRSRHRGWVVGQS